MNDSKRNSEYQTYRFTSISCKKKSNICYHLKNLLREDNNSNEIYVFVNFTNKRNQLLVVIKKKVAVSYPLKIQMWPRFKIYNTNVL